MSRTPRLDVAEDTRGPVVPLETIHPACFAGLASAVLSKAIQDLNSVQHRNAARRWLLYEFRETFWADYRITNAARLTQAVHGLQVLGQALRPFLTDHRLPMPEITKLAENNAREGFYSKADTDTLIAALPEELRDFVRWGSLTGWRKGEVTSLKWADVDRETGSLRLSWRSTKGKKARTMALVGELAAIIERRWQARTITLKSGATLISPIVFHRGEGTRKHLGEAAPVMDFDKAFKHACEVAGIVYGRKEGRTLHCFRRTAARNFRNSHVAENVIMAVTGHRTRSMFDRYCIVDEQDTRDAMTAVQAQMAALPAESNVVSLRAQR